MWHISHRPHILTLQRLPWSVDTKMKKEASNSIRDDLIQHLSVPIPFDISIDVWFWRIGHVIWWSTKVVERCFLTCGIWSRKVDLCWWEDVSENSQKPREANPSQWLQCWLFLALDPNFPTPLPFFLLGQPSSLLLQSVTHTFFKP